MTWPVRKVARKAGVVSWVGSPGEMSHNTWIHRLVRLGVKPLARTRITPNHLTSLRLLTGMTAAGLIATGARPWAALGGVMFIASFLLDRADGELARLSGKHSPSGHRFDLFSDALANSLAFVAIGIGLRDGNSLGYWAMPLGALAGIAIALNLWLVMAIEEIKGVRAAELGSLCGFDADDATLMLPVALWLGWDVPTIVLASICAPLFTVWASWHFTRLYRLSRSPFADLYQPAPSSRSSDMQPAVLRPVEQSRAQSSRS